RADRTHRRRRRGRTARLRRQGAERGEGRRGGDGAGHGDRDDGGGDPVKAMIALVVALAFVTSALAQDRPPTPPWTKDPPDRVPAKTDPQPKVPLRWDRYYHIDELQQAMRDLAAAWPQFVELRSIGKSVEGRDMLIAVVTDKATGA